VVRKKWPEANGLVQPYCRWERASRLKLYPTESKAPRLDQRETEQLLAKPESAPAPGSSQPASRWASFCGVGQGNGY